MKLILPSVLIFFALGLRAQQTIDQFVILTVERRQNSNIHPKEFDYWIIRPELWDKTLDKAISPLFIDGFSVQDFKECNLDKKLILFNPTKDENFNFTTEYISSQNILRSRIIKKVKILTMKKKWSSGKKETVNIYLTPINGNFSFCEMVHSNGGSKLGYEGVIAMPLGNFTTDTQFWKSKLASQVKQFDYTSLPFLGLQKIQNYH